MFQKKTAFVVGAGASKEFGMPTGHELRHDIAELLSRQSARSNGEQYSTFRATLMNTVGPGWNDYTGPGNELSAALPSFVSVDEALHYFASDEKIVRIGKLAIAFILLAYERSSKIAINRQTGRTNIKDCSETWLAELLSMALSFAQREKVRDAFSNLYFINFNYDRIIEQYVGNALSEIGRIPSSAAQKIASSLNIVRPYGNLGALRWGSGEGELPPVPKTPS
jgi:hypothetical protein